MSELMTKELRITSSDFGVDADSKDEQILANRFDQWNQHEGPRVGDYIRLKDGSLHRFSHKWQDGLQHSLGGSFYLGNGYMSFSGGLEPAIPLSQIVDTYEVNHGSAWFFHHDYPRAHNGVYVMVPCRVYEHVA